MHTASTATSTSTNTQDFHDAQIPVWKRNGKFVNFFRSFIGHKPKEKLPKTPVFGSELTKLLADTGDEGRYLKIPNMFEI